MKPEELIDIIRSGRKEGEDIRNMEFLIEQFPYFATARTVYLKMLHDSGHSELKLEATVNNAKQVLKIQDEFGSLSHYFWHFFDGKPLINNVPTYKDVPSSTDLSQQIAKNLKKRGFKFLGPTTIYSFLQAAGFVNDHENNCDFK